MEKFIERSFFTDICDPFVGRFNSAKIQTKYCMEVFIFGDSISRGNWGEEGGWAHKLKKEIHGRTVREKEYSEVYNLGVSGDTSYDLINRFEEEIQRRVSDEEVVTVFQIGMKDARIDRESGENETAKELFRGNIRELVSKADRYSKQSYFLGLTPVDGREVDPASWNDRYAYRNEDIKKYDNVIKSVVKRSSARYIPIFDQLHRQTEWKEMMWEGLHPDSDGHEKIYRIVEDEMRFI